MRSPLLQSAMFCRPIVTDLHVQKALDLAKSKPRNTLESNRTWAKALRLIEIKTDQASSIACSLTPGQHSAITLFHQLRPRFVCVSGAFSRFWATPGKPRWRPDALPGRIWRFCSLCCVRCRAQRRSSRTTFKSRGSCACQSRQSRVTHEDRSQLTCLPRRAL